MQTLLLIDGYSLMHRAFYALPALTNSKGIYTNAVFGFYNMLLKVVKDAAPTHLLVALDAHAPTFRHGEYAAYKGTRKPMPEELRPQLGLLRDTLTTIGIPWLEKPGFEADDIIGTYSKRAEDEGMQSIIVTGDRDSFQLISGLTSVWFTKKGLSEVDRLTPELVKEQYGITPAQVTDLKGLMGDSSDNIPGIAGVGEKTALKLLTEYETLENTLTNAASVKGKLGEKLAAGQESAVLSKHLATIVRDAPLDLPLQEMLLPDLSKARAPFAELEFRSLLERVPQGAGDAAAVSGETAVSRFEAPILAQNVEDIQAIIKEEIHAPCALLRTNEGISLVFAHENGLGKTVLIPVAMDLLTQGVDEHTALRALAPLFASPAPKRVFDGKTLKTQLARLGVTVNEEAPWFDAALAEYLLTPGTAPSANALLETQGRAVNAAELYLACDELQARLQNTGMLPLFQNIETPLADVLFAMEQTGFRVDRAALETLQADFGTKIERVQKDIYACAGQVFNINSPKQLGGVLFDDLGLTGGKKTKSGYSTNADTLEGLTDMHPIVPLVLEFRALSKLKSTYIDGLLKLSGADGIIHTTLNQTVTVTGRISSAEPNLQNIPVRTELGRGIRRVFIPLRDGDLLVDADYSQIELRVLAHMAGDENMIRAFIDGRDIHRETAARVYGVDPEAVTAKMRSSAKAVNFGIVYGISDFGLAKNIGVSRKEAADFIARYFEQYPAIKRFMEQSVKQAKTSGGAQTLFGRRRPIPELLSQNFNTRSFGERAAMNTPVQGSAADIIKIAMVRVSDALKKGGFKAKLILQVHDELIVSSPADEAEAAAELLQREMKGAAQLSVPLTADVKIGKSWFETK